MPSKVITISEYLDSLGGEERKKIIDIRKIILKNIPAGFSEVMSYGMIGYVVPHSIYPAGYHADPKQSLPFINLASQKNHIALYHMGLTADTKLLSWFQHEYQTQLKAKPDIGKSCIRFRKQDLIPLKLIGQLVSKITVKNWIETYEKEIRK